MDIFSLPKEQASAKTYKHFTINSQSEKKNGKGEAEFFYIGKNTLKIDFLIQTFGGGYAAENVNKAISLLTRINETTTVPDVIFVDRNFSKESLSDLTQFISDSKTYSLVPLVLDASGSSDDDLMRYRKYHFLDEIIFLDQIDAEQLKLKIRFLQKVKESKLSNQGPASQKNVYNHFETKNIIKRLFDVVVSFVLIILLSPVFLVIAIAIKLESRGPVLYISKRAGRGYQIFNFFKFRTMVADADQQIHQLSHLNHYSDHKKMALFFLR